MKRRSSFRSSRPPAGAAPHNPEVAAFVAAVLRQMDHAADLVVAFFRSIGMMGPDERAVPGLPREFLLELGSLLQLQEWHAAGVIDWHDPDGLSIDDLISKAIERLKDDPEAVCTGRQGTEALIGLLRRWNESCAPAAREHLGCDVSLRWDPEIDMDDMIDVLADFLCRHRDAAPHTEDE
jgi:hypothetical protein